MEERESLEQAIAALEHQRSVLGDPVVDAALAPLRARLAELQNQAAGEQRKLVTILFADLVGSTHMTETLDPEDVREILNTYFARWNAHIQEYSGMVEKFIGDAVMAVFGLATAREDDPERALRAALAMQRSLEELNQTFDRNWGIQLSMRVGVHTGQVVVSTLGERQGQDFVVVGEAVNLASRLQSYAPPDAVIISHATYRLVRGVFEVRPLENLQVKGFSEPIQPYLVLREKPRAFRMGRRGLEGLDIRMVGRERELQRLQEALFTIIEAGNQQSVLLSGEAGMGKSRLIYEFDKWLELIPDKVRYFKGRASPAMTTLPYALLRDVFSFRFEIQDSDSPHVLRDKLEQGMQAALGDRQDWQRRAHFIGRLLGFEFGGSPHLPDENYDAKSFHDQALIYLIDYFKALSKQLPLAILLEDLQWADDSSLDLLRQLGPALAHNPVLIVCSTRPELFERRPRWVDGQAALVHVELGQLSPRDSRRLVNEILQKAETVPDQLLDMVLSNAEGNPFYIEELIKMLIEVGGIRTGDDRWRIDISRLAAASIPSTLVGVLQARLDSLESAERLCLQRAAVVGRIFWAAAVAYLEEKSPDGSQSATLLHSLHQREMIFKRGTSAFADTLEYLFKHALLRDVAYQSLLKNHRRTYHARTARWLESVTAGTGRADEYAGLIAEHLDQADESRQAVRWYRRAGEQAAAKYANVEAAHLFSRALELTPETEGELRYSLLTSREAAYDLLGDRPAQAQDLQELKMLAEKSEDAYRRAEIALKLCDFLLKTGDFSEARRTAGQAAEWLETEPQADPRKSRLLVDAYNHLGHADRLLGDVENARQELETSWDLAQAIDYLRGEIYALENIGTLHTGLGNYDQALHTHQKGLALAQKLGDQRLERSLFNNLGIAAKERGDYRAAARYYRQSQAIANAMGERLGENIALNNLGEIEQLQGDHSQAINYTRQSLAIAREIGDRNGEAISLANLGEAYASAGEYEQAKQYHNQALEVMRDTGFRMGEGITLGNLAAIALTQTDYTTAESLSTQALEIAREVGDRLGQGIVLQHLADAKAHQNEAAAATNAYNQALDVWGELGQDSGRYQALAGLARLALAGEDDQDLDQACESVKSIAAELTARVQIDMETPMEVYLTCWQVLQARKEPHARQVLSQAYSLLQARAARISDPELRRSFLENIPVHQRLAQAWQGYAAKPAEDERGSK